MKLLGPQDADDGQGVAAQTVRVGGAGGVQPHAEETADGVQPVGQAHQGAYQISGQDVVGVAGQVMAEEGRGHLRVLAGEQGVLLAHDPLEAGELAHHLGGDVRLGQGGGPINLIRQFRGQLTHGHRQIPEALHLLVGGAQGGVEHHPFEGVHPVFQGHFRVHLKEIHGVAEAGAEHPLVALAHHVGVPGQGIIDRDEMRQQLAVLAPREK